MLFTCCFFPEHLLSDVHTLSLHPAWGYLTGRFVTLYTPGVEHFVVIVISCHHRKFLLGCLAGWWVLLSYFIGVTMAWKVYCLLHLISILLICYLYCHYTIQMHVEFNSIAQLHAFYQSTQWQIKDTFNICMGAFLQVNECTPEVLLFLWCQNDILSIFAYFDSCTLL